MKLKPLVATLAGLAVAATATTAEAHTFGAAGAGFAQGMAHPFGGLDHLLAMVAVGLWAAQSGGRALWLVPASFVTMMVVGAVLGMTGVQLPMVEGGIMASLLILGGLVAFARRMPTVAGVALTGALAVFHGHAHGAEMPQAASIALYGLGFVAATVALHAVGAAAALRLGKLNQARLVRAGGAAIAVAGVALAAL